MKVILSRKGFDSQYGKIDSPILPDGTLLSLPIPQNNDSIRFDELYYKDKSYFNIIKELKHNWKYPDNQAAHLDPDIRKEAYNKRSKDWKPIFGQSAAAQGHLKKQGVGIGDIFLFFGSFGETQYNNQKLEYKKSVEYPKGRHVIFGYLQIGEIHELNTDADYNALPDFTQYHSHANKHFIENDGKARSNNCIYIASEKLSFNNDLAGGGTFNYNEKRVLTKKGRNKSMWELKDFFKNLNISYHKKESFINDYFQSAAKGQEFVIQEDPNLSKWVKKIIEG
jgi:hypothetical protein